MMIFQKRNDFHSHDIHMVSYYSDYEIESKWIYYLDHQVKDKVFDISKEGKINSIYY
jgi:hypothetical protein